MRPIAQPFEIDEIYFRSCFLVIGLVVRLPGISDRMFFLPYAARPWWPPNAKMEPESLPYKTKPQLGLVPIDRTPSWLEQGERLPRGP